MDNQRNPDVPQDDSWLDDILSAPALADEIGPDEHAVSSAGLTHPSDAELERIIAETKSDDWEEEARMTEQEPFRDEEYRDTFGDGDELAAIIEGELPPVEEGVIPPDLDDTPEEYPEEPEPEEPPVRKRRPRMKKGYGLLGIPHILATVIWLAIAVTIGVSFGRILWVCAADVLAFGREDQQVTVTITDTDNIDTIASKLKNAGLIRYPQLFKMYANLTHAEEDISTGTFTLTPLYDYHALVNAMTYYSSGREEVEIMIPEGYTCAQIFSALEEKGVCTVAELEEYAANGELDDYWFLEGVERGDKYCLEGYLFPDTYKFYTNDDPERVLEKFLDDFDYRFTDIMHDQLEVLNQRLAEMMASHGYDQDFIDSHLFTIREVVIVASMVEKETGGIEESYKISSVIYNRLTNMREYPFLNIDATIVYALGGKTDPLTYEDLQIDSPYNTYTNTGLIPGPISNPGQSSLYAALDPETWEEAGGNVYYYYALNPSTGRHEFFTTQSKFEAFVASVSSD